MPSKSRKNRRFSPPVKKSTVASMPGTTTAASQTATPAFASAAAPSGSSKAAPVVVPSGGYLLHELRWIGTVTAVIVILLIVAYYVFR